jgi:hypothetical protein
VEVLRRLLSANRPLAVAWGPALLQNYAAVFAIAMGFLVGAVRAAIR